MRNRSKEKHNQITEEDVLSAYLRLLKALVSNAFEIISVPAKWGKERNVSKRTLEKKSEEIEHIATWLSSPASEFWFSIYESCLNVISGKTKYRFEIELRRSRRKMGKLLEESKTKLPIDVLTSSG